MNTLVNFVNEHHNTIITTLIIGDVIVVSIGIWMKVQLQSLRFQKQNRKESDYVAEYFEGFDSIADGRTSSATSNDKTESIVQKNNGIVFPQLG